MRTAYIRIYYFLFLIGIFLLAQTTNAQKAGFIYTPAANGGQKVLDPNGDGYVSLSTAGFIGGDIGSNYSERPYRFFPQFGTEPLNDLVTGSNGGHTDLAEPPLGMYFDGTNVLFRVRLGGSSTASKGYSYFFDTDGIFNAKGIDAQTGLPIPYATPSKVINLGFEYEVVFASNFDVRVYKHNGNGDDTPYTATQIWTGNLDTYSQRSIAYNYTTSNPSNIDYFYDFYVPLSAFGGGITASTQLRLTGSTVTSAQSGLTGTISDIGGVDDRLYANDKATIWKQLIPAFPLTSLTDLQNGDFKCMKSTAPVITSSVKQFDSSISGTSSEAVNTVIKIYSGGTVSSATGAWATTGTLLGSGTVSATGIWTVSINPVIPTAGTVIRATATSISPQKCESNPSTAVTATNGVCSTPTITTTINPINGRKGYTGTYVMPSYLTGTTNRVRIMLYNVSTSNVMSRDTVLIYGGGGISTSAFYTGLSAGSTVNWTITSGSGNALTDGTYVIRVAINGGCISGPSVSNCSSNGATTTTTTPTITTISPSPATSFTIDKTSSTSITVQGSIGTTTATSTKVYLYRNGNPTGHESPVVTTSGGTYTITLTTTDLSGFSAGDILTVRAIGTTATANHCLSAVSTQSVTIYNGTTIAPTITTSLCLPSTGSSSFTLYGTSTELGSTITIFNNGVALTTTPATVIVNGQGIWSAAVTATAPFSITAKATATNKNISAASSVASISTQATNTAANGLDFYSSNFTTLISGTNYIYEGTGADGAVYGKVSVPTNTRATIKVYINKDRLASDVTVTIDNLTGSTTTGNWSLTQLSPQELFVGGLVTATVTYSSLGSGGTVSCESNHITPSGIDPYNGGTAVQYDYVQCQTAPVNKTITWQAGGTICHSSKISATVASSEVGVLYQMTRDNISTGDPVVGTGSAIILYSAAITSTASGTLRIVATKNNTSFCQTILTTTQAITAYTLGAALTTPLIAASPTSVCKGSSVIISLSNAVVNTGTYQLFRNGVAQGSPITATTANQAFPAVSIQVETDFYVVYTNASGCTSTSATTKVTVKGPDLTKSVTIDKTSSCTSPSTVTISFGTENVATYTYQVVQVSLNGTVTNTNIGSSFTGDGTVKTLSTSLSTSGTYVFKVNVTDGAGTGCGTQSLTNQVTTSVSASPATANAYTTTNGIATNESGVATATKVNVNANTVTLSGSDPSPGTGQWTIYAQPTGSSAYFSDATQKNATVYGLITGTYTFKWTVTGVCAPVSSTVSFISYNVTANTPTTYSVEAPEYANTITIGETLATASDLETFNSNASCSNSNTTVAATPATTIGNTGSNFQYVTGSSIPPNTALDCVTGRIYATGALTPGTYSMTVRSKDKNGNFTDIPMTMTFYPNASNRSIEALPVELIYFNAAYSNKKVTLNWATASETNNEYFEVERSVDGKTFNAIGKIKGAGNSVLVLKYSFNDNNPKAGTVYYRLKQVDLDQTKVYSRIISVKISDLPTLEHLITYPNPAKDILKIKVANAGTEDYTLTLHNLVGTKILQKKVSFSADITETELSLKGLSAGTYILTANSSKVQLVSRILKIE